MREKGGDREREGAAKASTGAQATYGYGYGGGKGWEEVNDGEEPRSDEQSLASLASAGLCIWWGLCSLD
jgi:hypothetical protein